MDLSQSIGACPVCRSTRYHRNEAGFLLCEYGHQSQGFWEEQDDQETYFGSTKKLATRGSQSRSSQVSDTEDAYKNEIIRSGDVEKFVILELIQRILRKNIDELSDLFNIPAGFGDTVKIIWLTYVSSLQITYDEEGVGELLPSQISRRSSQSTLSLESDLENLQGDLSGDDLDFMNAPSPLPTEMIGMFVPHTGRIRFAIIFPVLALSCLYHSIPLVTSDLLRLANTGQLSFYNVSSFVDPVIEKILTRSQKSILKNPVQVDWRDAGRGTVLLAKLMNLKLGKDLPMMDQRVLLWKIGEELGLPYLFREDLVALSVRLRVEYQIGLRHDRFSSSPLISAFVLTIFFLKLHYGLLDSGHHHAENARFLSSGFPTQFQLLQFWRAKLKSLKTNCSHDAEGIQKDLDLYRNVVIPSKINTKEVNEDDLSQIKRAIAGIPNRETPSHGQSPLPWLETDPDQVIDISDFWATKYACSSLHHKDQDFSSWSEAYSLLLEIGGRFCCAEPRRLHAMMISLFETNAAAEVVKSVFVS